MTLQQQIVDEARTWANTRFQHQGRLKGQGIDCVGFIAEVAKAVGVDVDIPSDYRPRENGDVMKRLLREHMTLVNEAQPGDVLALIDEALRDPDIPTHLAFVTNVTPKTTFIIHASAHGVKEHRIDGHFKKRIHSIWRIND